MNNTENQNTPRPFEIEKKTYNPKPATPFNPGSTHQPKAPAPTQEHKPSPPPSKND